MSVERMFTTEARRACILAVDDEPLVAAVMAETLELEGYEVDTAKNGREALEKIATRSYDVILSDLRMPELDGVGLYRELEQQHPSLLPRLVFVSGNMKPPEYASFLERTGRRPRIISSPRSMIGCRSFSTRTTRPFGSIRDASRP